MVPEVGRKGGQVVKRNERGTFEDVEKGGSGDLRRGGTQGVNSAKVVLMTGADSTPGNPDRGTPSDAGALSPVAGTVLHAGDILDWASACDYLQGRPNAEAVKPSEIEAAKVFRPERMVALMDALGNPQRAFKTVHVAGSKGKGSVCEMSAACLESCGYTVGLYTSPHLVELRERIRINQNQISREDFVAGLSKAARAAETLPKKLGVVTYFELLTAIAFIHFAEYAVDIAVIEVGLGGRLDATNVIVPEVSALAAIHLEHTELLGKTLEAIAGEKAGIIKPAVPAISVPQTPEVLEVFRNVAASNGTTLSVLGADLEFSARSDGDRLKVVLASPRSTYEHLLVPLRGEHQAINCGLALAILDALRARGFDTPERLVAEGLARTPLNGRLEQIHAEPRVFVDGAHTPESIQGVMKAIGSQMKYDSLVVVFGCASDKDAGGMLKKLSQAADKIIFTKASGSHRATDPRELQRKCSEHSAKMTQVAASVREAVNLAARAVARGDLILVTGSFLIAGEAKRLFIEKQQGGRRPGNDGISEVKPPTPTKPKR